MSIIFVDSFFPRLQALVFSSFVCGLWIGECCDLGSLTQRLVHVLALRLNSLSSWGVGNLGALFNQSMLMGSELSKCCNCYFSSSGDCPMMLFSDEFLRF